MGLRTTNSKHLMRSVSCTSDFDGITIERATQAKGDVLRPVHGYLNLFEIGSYVTTRLPGWGTIGSVVPSLIWTIQASDKSSCHVNYKSPRPVLLAPREREKERVKERETEMGIKYSSFLALQSGVSPPASFDCSNPTADCLRHLKLLVDMCNSSNILLFEVFQTKKNFGHPHFSGLFRKVWCCDRLCWCIRIPATANCFC